MDVDMRLIWFILAGFLLGFSVSTLWEWLYFRGRRAKVRELSRPADAQERRDGAAIAPEDGGAAIAPEDGGAAIAPEDGGAGDWERSYAGPGVYLEFEDETDDADAVDADDDQDDAPFGASDATVDEEDETHEGDAGSRVHDPRGRRDYSTGFVAPLPAARSTEAGPGSRPAPARPTVARTSRPAMPETIVHRAQETTKAPTDRVADKPTDKSTDKSTDSVADKVEPKPSRAADAEKPTAPQRDAQAEARPAVIPKPQAQFGAGQRLRKTGDYPDDLAKIKGIGEVYRQRLYAAGIYTWHQIAQTDEETLRAATQAYPSSNADEWAAQAQSLAEKHGRVGAVYTGPTPQELTRIYGIGPVGAATLYRTGVCTYAQLAALTPAELAPLFPIAVAGDEPDFTHWIEQAREYSEDG